MQKDAQPTLLPGTYPAWLQRKTYQAGDQVLFDWLAYRAKWANQGVSPSAEASDPSGSPWKPMFRVPGEPAG